MSVRIAGLAFVISLLAGCSLAPAVNSDVLDYFKANDLATNRVILLNILLARDRAPMHFSELANIHGSLSLSLTSTTAEPFGPVSQPPGLSSGVETPALAVTSAPSFDVNSLDTQDFVGGMIQPISAGTAKYFLEEGLDSHLVLMLLAQGILIPGQKEMFLNAPDSVRRVCYDIEPSATQIKPNSFAFAPPNDDKCANNFAPLPEYFAFLNILDHYKAFYPVAISVPGPKIGGRLRLDSAKYLVALSRLDSGKYRLKPDSDGYYQLFKAPEHAVILCKASDGTNADQEIVQGMITDDDPSPLQVPANACDPAADPAAHAKPIEIGEQAGTFIIKLRSTAELVRYVGRILALQDRMTKSAGTPQCITLQYQRRASGNSPADTCGGGALFDVSNRSGPHDSGIDVTYDHAMWVVPDAEDLRPANDPSQYGVSPADYDHSLETMAIISLLINQNKSSKDISKTANVQLVP